MMFHITQNSPLGKIETTEKEVEENINVIYRQTNEMKTDNMLEKRRKIVHT